MKLGVVVAFITIILFSLFSLTLSSAANFQRISLTTLNPDAVCNDGSPATYFFRAGSGTGAGIYTIYLEGGGFCQDLSSCNARWQYQKHFMTSTQLPQILNDTTKSPDVNHGGINSGDPTINPHFYNANQAYLWYCSSDSHAGNAANTSALPWYFRGHIIVETLVNHLLTVQGMSNAKFILLTGFSAGAFGVFNNADFVGQQVQKGAPAATYKAYADSGWLLDVPTYNPALGASRYGVQELFTNFNAQLDESCTSIYDKIGQGWRCLFADFVLPFISTPIFVAGYQFDSPFLNDVSPPFNSSTGEYANLLRQDFLMQSQIQHSFFSPNCYCHGVESFDTRWNVIKVGGTTASDAVWNFFINNIPSRNVDSCVAVNCNPTCYCVYN